MTAVKNGTPYRPIWACANPDCGPHGGATCLPASEFPGRRLGDERCRFYKTQDGTEYCSTKCRDTDISLAPAQPTEDEEAVELGE